MFTPYIELITTLPKQLLIINHRALPYAIIFQAYSLMKMEKIVSKHSPEGATYISPGQRPGEIAWGDPM